MQNEIISNPNYLRNKVLKGMAATIGLFCLLVIMVNIYLGAYFLAILEVLLAIVCFCVYKKSKADTISGWQSYLLPYFFLLVVLYGSYIKDLNEGLFLWCYIMPTLFYLLYGNRHGFITVLAVGIIQTAIILSKEGTELYNTTLISINFLLAYVSVWVVSHIYEKNRVIAQNSLKDLALRDPLTNAFNRLALKHHFDTIIDHNSPFSVVIIDIDLFKLINDTYGHDAGDLVLCRFVEQFRLVLADHEIYRIGGEEFALLVQKEPEHILEIVNQLLVHTQNTAIEYDGQHIQFTFSAGIAAGAPTTTLSELLKAADVKLYEAKQSGRCRIL